jgi:nucleoside-diphosphate-sugar epimerase
MEKHFIIGPGVIGQEVFSVLQSMNKEVYLSGRSDRNIKNYIQLDALNKSQVIEKTKGMTHVYITIGLPYNKKLWRNQWPIIVDNIIEASLTNAFKIIFFDNVYAYGRLHNPVTEQHDLSPISQKGLTRKIIDEKLIQVMKTQDVMIVRSPDFFGPKANNSVCYIGFLENMIKGKDPSFIGSANKKHSYGYTIDLARATVELSLQEDTYGQTWHLPCYQIDSIEEVVLAYNKSLSTRFKLKTMSIKAHKVLSIFIPILKELLEMRYQFDEDYILDFSKFKSRFPDFILTPFQKAIESTVSYFKSKSN